jgi:hypothetical protein
MGQVNVHVYEKERMGYKRISCFDVDGARRTVRERQQQPAEGSSCSRQTKSEYQCQAAAAAAAAMDAARCAFCTLRTTMARTRRTACYLPQGPGPVLVHAARRAVRR